MSCTVRIPAMSGALPWKSEPVIAVPPIATKGPEHIQN